MSKAKVVGQPAGLAFVRKSEREKGKVVNENSRANLRALLRTIGMSLFEVLCKSYACRLCACKDKRIPKYYQ